MAATRPTVSHVLFDMDGLLINTEDIYTIAQQKLLEPYGKTSDWSLKTKLMGKRADESARILIEELSLPVTAEELKKQRDDLHAELMPSCSILPGVERLVQHLKVHNVPMAVATSSFGDMFTLKTSHLKTFFDNFNLIVCGDDPEVKIGKPNPDIFLVAARRLGVAEDNLGNVLVFEDAPNGVLAAHAAGMPVVLVPHPEMSVEGIQADAVIPSMVEFDPAQWGLPAYP